MYYVSESSKVKHFRDLMTPQSHIAASPPCLLLSRGQRRAGGWGTVPLLAGMMLIACGSSGQAGKCYKLLYKATAMLFFFFFPNIQQLNTLPCTSLITSGLYFPLCTTSVSRDLCCITHTCMHTHLHLLKKILLELHQLKNILVLQ